MHTKTRTAIERLADRYDLSIVRMDDDAVILDEVAGSRMRVYRVGGEWIFAIPYGDGWRSSDAPKAYLRANPSFNYFAANTISGLLGSVRSYRSATDALKAQIKAWRGY